MENFSYMRRVHPLPFCLNRKWSCHSFQYVFYFVVSWKLVIENVIIRKRGLFTYILWLSILKLQHLCRILSIWPPTLWYFSITFSISIFISIPNPKLFTWVVSNNYGVFVLFIWEGVSDFLFSIATVPSEKELSFQ